ncbi:MAG TPA: GDSL-type esterase/lipase family protein [Thermoanaerobaculia bacterium]|jgi:lysophospholipase L1-like esterase
MGASVPARTSRYRTGVGVWLLRALVVCLSFALALILAELVLHQGAPASAVRRVEASDMSVHDPLLGWSPAPGARTRQRSREYDVAVRINSQGFRADREYAPEPPPGTLRIVAVGDSFTFGQGVKLAHAWPSILERRLANAEVVNLGVPGYGVDQQLLMLESRGLRFRPDLVILGLHMPDVFRNTAAWHRGYGKPVFRFVGDELKLTNVPVPPPGPPPPPLRRGLLERSRLFQLVSVRLERHGFGEVWDVTEGIFRRMARVTAETDARLIVLLLPTQHAVYGNALDRRLQARTAKRIAAILREIGIEHLDLTPALAAAADRNPRETLFYLGDGHFTAAGNRVVAERILQHLATA